MSLFKYKGFFRRHPFASGIWELIWGYLALACQYLAPTHCTIVGLYTLCYQRPVDVGDLLPVPSCAPSIPVHVVLCQHGPRSDAQSDGHARPLPHRHNLPMAAAARLVQQNGQGVNKIIM